MVLNLLDESNKLALLFALLFAGQVAGQVAVDFVLSFLEGDSFQWLFYRRT